MAKKWEGPGGMRIESVEAQGIFTRWADDVREENFKERLRVEEWEIVVPTIRLSRRRSALRESTRQSPAP